jgi:hypothetical protein
MPTITVTVLRNDTPVKGARVALGVGLIEGTYGPEHTDYDGTAEFEVKYGEGGDVFVNGSKEGHWGSTSATDITVEL